MKIDRLERAELERLFNSFLDAYTDLVYEVSDYLAKMIHIIVYDKVSFDTGLSVDELNENLSENQVYRIFDRIYQREGIDISDLIIERIKEINGKI